VRIHHILDRALLYVYLLGESKKAFGGEHSDLLSIEAFVALDTITTVAPSTRTTLVVTDVRLLSARHARIVWLWSVVTIIVRIRCTINVRRSTT
jgi:hypothetical protein